MNNKDLKNELKKATVSRMCETINLDRFSEIFLKQILTLMDKKSLKMQFDPTFYTTLLKNFGEEIEEEPSSKNLNARKGSNKAKRGKKSSRNQNDKKKSKDDISTIPMLYNRYEFILKEVTKKLSQSRFEELKNLNFADEQFVSKLFKVGGADGEDAFNMFGESKSSKNKLSLLEQLVRKRSKKFSEAFGIRQDENQFNIEDFYKKEIKVELKEKLNLSNMDLMQEHQLTSTMNAFNGLEKEIQNSLEMYHNFNFQPQDFITASYKEYNQNFIRAEARRSGANAPSIFQGNDQDTDDEPEGNNRQLNAGSKFFISQLSKEQTKKDYLMSLRKPRRVKSGDNEKNSGGKKMKKVKDKSNPFGFFDN